MLKVNFTQEDLLGIYGKPDDCPIYRALSRLGYNVVAISENNAYVKLDNSTVKLRLKNSSEDYIVACRENIDRENVYFEIEEKILDCKQ